MLSADFFEVITKTAIGCHNEMAKSGGNIVGRA